MRSKMLISACFDGFDRHTAGYGCATLTALHYRAIPTAMRNYRLLSSLVLVLVGCGDSSGNASADGATTGGDSTSTSTAGTTAGSLPTASASGSQSASESNSSGVSDTASSGPLTASETAGETESGGTDTLDSDSETGDSETGEACVDACDDGELACVGDDALHECGETRNGCLEWSDPEPCGDGKTCEDGACIVGCVDACELDSKQCSGDGTSTCIDDPRTSCTVWSEAVACAEGKACEDGECIPIPELCLDECVWTKEQVSADIDLYSVWGSDAKKVWAVGESGTALYYNGSKWKSVDSGIGKRLDCVHGSASDDVYAISYDGEIIRWDGEEWLPYANLYPFWEETACITAIGTGDVLAAVWDSNPEAVRLYRIKDGEKSLLGSADVYIWSPDGSKPKTMSMRGFSPTEAIVVAYRTYRWDGALKNMGAPNPSFGAWVSSPDLIYVASGHSGIGHRWKNDAWKIVNPGLGGYLHMFSGTAEDRIFGVGEVKSKTNGAVVTFDGIGWSPATIPDDAKPLFATWAAPTGEVFAVGKEGTILVGK